MSTFKAFSSFLGIKAEGGFEKSQVARHEVLRAKRKTKGNAKLQKISGAGRQEMVMPVILEKNTMSEKIRYLASVVVSRFCFGVALALVIVA